MKKQLLLLVAGIVCTVPVTSLMAEKETQVPAIKKLPTVPVITRGEIKIIEATENIRFISQKMAKEYLFLLKTPHSEEIRERLKQSLIALSDQLRTIAAATKDTNTKDMLEFLSYSKDQIAQIISEKVTQEQAALMMDYSETLLEGADSIAEAHKYPFSKEESMLIVAKKMEYLLERIMKYYLALHVGFDNAVNEKQMNKAIGKFNENMNLIRAYRYPEDVMLAKEEMNRSWHVNEHFFERSKTMFIPKLMVLSTDYLERLTQKIALYHSQNQ